VSFTFPEVYSGPTTLQVAGDGLVELETTISISLSAATEVADKSAVFQEPNIETVVTSDLQTGERGNLNIDISIEGAGRSSSVLSGTLKFDFNLDGRVTGNYVIGSGSLPIQLKLDGAAHSASLSDDAALPLELDFKVKGSSIVGVLATGSMNFWKLDIESDVIIGILGETGSLPIDLLIDSKVFSEVFNCVVMNTSNFALTEYDYEMNSLVYFNGHYLGASKTTLYELIGDKDDGSQIDWYFTTGKIDMEKDNVNRLRYVWLSYNPSGDLILTVYDGLTEYEYEVEDYGIEDDSVRVKVGKGIKSKYLKFKLSNSTYENVEIDRIRLFVEPVAKNR